MTAVVAAAASHLYFSRASAGALMAPTMPAAQALEGVVCAQ